MRACAFHNAVHALNRLRRLDPMALYVFLYLLAGILLAEGSYWAARKNTMPFRWVSYLIIVTMWPLMVIVTIYKEYGSKS